MPWNSIRLNDGNVIPGIGYGTWKLGNGQGTTDLVDQAISVGFSHIDTAQLYRNEAEAGLAIRESGLSREEIFVTTKYSGVGGLDIPTSIRGSLKNLDLTYVDLYLIHHPRLAVPDIPTVWRQMEEIKNKGWAKSIGISNFNVADMKILLASAKIKPAVNQILLHPYVYAQQLPILEYAKENDIVIEAFSPLTPITSRPGGAVDVPVSEIANRFGVTMDQVLLAWAREKGAVVLTSSSKRQRMIGYIEAGEIDLTKDDIAAIDLAGSSLTIAERIRESGIQWTINASILFGIFYLVKIRSQNPVPF